MHLLSPRRSETYGCNTRKRKHVANHRKLPEEVEDDWEEVSVYTSKHKTINTAPRSATITTSSSIPSSVVACYSPKEIEESKSFYSHSDHRPLAENEEHAGKEADGAPDLLFPCEKVECLLRSDEKSDTGSEEYIAQCE